MSAHARHLVRTAAIAAAICAIALVAAVGDANAYYTAGGRASASAAVTTLPTATVTATNTGAGSVALRWTAVTAPASGAVTYWVARDGGAASAACPSAAAPTSATSCTDTGVSAGAHTYVVTAVWRTWTKASAGARVTVAYGVATQLVFTTQPAGATGGSAFATQPAVTARDASGNTVLDYAGSVALSLRGGTAGAALSGCVGTLRNGVTSFGGCAIDKVGSGYSLVASDRTLSAGSAAFDVTPGAATRLVFSTQPGGGAISNAAFPTQPVVAAQDAGGNTATGYAGTVTLSIASGGTAGATLSGCTSTLTRGVTTFTGCKIDKSGTGYVLRARDGTLSSDSAAFNVAAPPAVRLVFSTQPAGATGGSAFATQPVVTAQDAGGNTATGYAGTVTLSIASGGGAGATLSGCTGTLSAGVTTFRGCAIDRVGTSYVLAARDGSLSVNSASFNVTAGAATRLAFTTQPAGATANSAFTTQPVVTAFDAGGNVATGYAGTLSASLVAGSSTLSGCQTSVSAGVTTFTKCKIKDSGTGYVMRASDGTLFADSNPFNVAP